MDSLETWMENFRQDRPRPWADLPDLQLYMDQVLSYLPRQHIGLTGEDTLTSAMVNNYIKEGLLPRAEGKRYQKTHLAYLTAILALKPVLSVREMQTLLQAEQETQTPDARYAVFCEELDGAVESTAQVIDQGTEGEHTAQLVLRLALRSYAHQLACRNLLQTLIPAEAQPQGKKK